MRFIPSLLLAALMLSSPVAGSYAACKFLMLSEDGCTVPVPVHCSSSEAPLPQRDDCQELCQVVGSSNPGLLAVGPGIPSPLERHLAVEIRPLREGNDSFIATRHFAYSSTAPENPPGDVYLANSVFLI